MKKSLNTSNSKRQPKDKHFKAQMKVVYGAFYAKPKTMLMVEIETGIMRSNICRYVAKWKKSERIAIVRTGVCPISKDESVQFLTTNRELFPIDNQLNLF